MSRPQQPLPASRVEFEQWGNLKAELIWIYDGEVHPRHLRLCASFVGQSAFLIRQGELLISNDRGRIEAGPGEWVLPRQGRRLQEFSPGSKVLSIRFYWNWPGGQPPFEWDTAVRFQATEAPLLESRARSLRQITVRNFPDNVGNLSRSPCDLATRMELQQAFGAWLVVITQSLTARGLIPSRLGTADSRILQAVQWLDNHPLDKPLRDGELAARFSLGASQMTRLFKQHLKVTPHDYFERRKLGEAVIRLQGSSEPVKQIAFELGFSSSSHFCHWLRRKTNLSPLKLREQPTESA